MRHGLARQIEFLLRARVVPKAPVPVEALGKVCLPELRLQRQGPVGGVLCRIQPRIGPIRGEKVHVHVRPAEQGLGQGEFRILGNRLIEQIDRLRHQHPGQPVLIVGVIGERQRAQIQIVGFRILRRHARQLGRLGRREFGLERIGHFLRDFAFDAEDVVECARIGLGPQVVVARGIDQLYVDQHRVAGLLHAAFEDRGDAELQGDRLQVVRMAGVFFRRRTRDDFQVADSGQLGQDHVLHAAGEVFIVLVAAEVLEREHRDGLAVAGRRNCCRWY